MIQQPLDGESEKLLASLRDDGLTAFLLDGGRFRGTFLHGTRMITEMQANHRTGPLETYALGEFYLAAGLLSREMKNHERIAIDLECGGPLKGAHAEASAEGLVRGYLAVNPIPLESPPESLDLSPLIGPGFLSVTRYLQGAKQPFTGQVMVQYGSVARDMAHYYLTSENTPSAFNLSIKFDRTGRVIGAAGLFLQIMPEEERSVSEDTLEAVEKRVTEMPSLGLSVSEGRSGGEILENSFGGYGLKILQEQPVAFGCTCRRERFESYLRSLSRADKDDILAKGPFPLETVCHNCNTTYRFKEDDLKQLFA